MPLYISVWSGAQSGGFAVLRVLYSVYQIIMSVPLLQSHEIHIGSAISQGVPGIQAGEIQCGVNDSAGSVTAQY